MTAFGPPARLAATDLVPGAEDAAALAVLVRDALGTGVKREVLRVRLGGLAGPGSQGAAPHHQRLVLEALAPLLRPSRARLFALPNGDLVAAAPPGAGHAAAVAERVRTLLAGLEEGAAEDRPPAGLPAVGLMRLPEDALALMVALEAAVSPVADTEEAAPAPPGIPATAEDAATLERAVANASVSGFLRWRPVVRLGPGGEPGGAGPVPQWTDWRLALRDLAATLLPGRDIEAAPGLARRVRGLLDRRLLAELAHPEEARKLGPAGLALGLSALAAPEFRRFDEALGQPGRAKVVLCLSAAEAVADPAGFLAARAVLARRRFRIALDLPDGAALPLLVEPDRLGVDFIRLPWRPGLAPAPAARLPAGRVVLTRADRAAAIAWGWEAGITLFEGRMLRG